MLSPFFVLLSWPLKFSVNRMERNPTDVTPYKEPGASGNPGSLQQPEESVIQPGIQLFTLPSPLVGTLTISTANLGAGRYSEVFLGTWTRNEEVMAVAIKRLRTVGSGLGFQERFNRVFVCPILR